MTAITLALSTGEPAGIGPDIALAIAGLQLDCKLAVLGNIELLAARAAQIGYSVQLEPFSGQAHEPGCLTVVDQPLITPVVAGQLNPDNVPYVLKLLDEGIYGTLNGRYQALVTGPVHKGVINDAGIPFTGHTEYLARACQAPLPVMMLTAGTLRVALATTHLSLRQVPDQITQSRLRQVLSILETALRHHYGLKRPRITVTGLNPHAGEGGHLGNEEQEIISPVLESLRSGGMRLTGPLPADSAFTPPVIEATDAFLAMYHDQGLTILKYYGFGRAVNVTLGLPIIRTSVDHGTALDLAGHGQAHTESLQAALQQAINMALRRSL